MRILVVDDVDDNREIYRLYLCDAGYDVDVADNGLTALQKIEDEAPQVVVMDLAMPVLDGLETTRRIKNNPGTREIIVIIVTGFASADDFARATAAGADAVRAKPFLPADLRQMIERLTARRDMGR